ncbi:MAG: hypothetical protein ACE5PM_08170 [Candidatus Hydrothermarchaeales archaeon]
MARRRRYMKKRITKGQRKKNGDSSRKNMLDMGRIESFRWNLKNLLDDLPDPQDKGAIFANICTKSTNIGIKEAKEYILHKKEDGAIDENTSNELLRLLDKFGIKR